MRAIPFSCNNYHYHRGENYIHRQCGHEQKRRIAQYCPAYNDTTTSCRNEAFADCGQRQVTSPELCIRCFHIEHDEIAAKFNAKIAESRRQIKHIEENAMDTKDPLQLDMASGNLIRLAERIRMYESDRYHEFQDFVLEQGVWGDVKLDGGERRPGRDCQ
ncbi:hypothetical protein MMC21_004820 [Puttea exsequens]|nr:hypothetical protein [Puttea exsequens]